MKNLKKSDFSLIFIHIYIFIYYTMIKRYLLTWLLGTILFLWLAKWASSWRIDFINNLWENIEFGYLTDTVEVDNLTTNKITLKSPFILDWSWNKITKYRIMYSTTLLSEMTEDTSLLSQSMEKQFNIVNTSDSTFTMDLIATWDNFSWDKIYYALVLPEDNNWMLWELSNEICFKLNTKIYWDWDDCVKWRWKTLEDHGAWWADMSLANISFTRNWNTITLRWISLEWSDQLEIFLRDRDNEEYNKLWTVDMIDEEYSFTTSKNGEHRIKFIPDNWWTEKIYTFQVQWISSWTPPPAQEPWIPKVPKVGPKENIIAIIIFTLAIYVIYRRSRRHS